MKPIKCKICGRETYHCGTRLCDRCWELITRIKNDLELAKEILAKVEKGEL